MPRASKPTRRRILQTAYDLFYRKGYARVSVDEIAAHAKLTKRTLYYHFRSKDDLLAAVLAHHSEMAVEGMARMLDRLPRGPAGFVDAYFGELAKWAAKPRWSGAGFTRLVMELADLPGHPARAIAKKHKAALEKSLADALGKSQVKSPREQARAIMLLMEGAMALILIHGDTSYAASAARAAKRSMRA
jgi:AcrR family transcriptional regulator